MGRYQVTSTAAVKEMLLNRANGEDLEESLPRAGGHFGGTRVGDVGVVDIYGDLRGSLEMFCGLRCLPNSGAGGSYDLE